MNINIQSAIKPTFLFIFWLIFSPLFLVFSIIWKMPRLRYRVVLTLIAPFTLLVLLITEDVAERYYTCYFKRGTRTEVETKTGVKFPEYKTLEKRHFTFGPKITGDFDMEYSVKFDTVKIQDFYNQIEIQINNQRTNFDKDSVLSWSINEDGNYKFIQPLSESTETLELEINKKNFLINIKYGSW
jgi:hypothetical protein